MENAVAAQAHHHEALVRICHQFFKAQHHSPTATIALSHQQNALSFHKLQSARRPLSARSLISSNLGLGLGRAGALCDRRRNMKGRPCGAIPGTPITGRPTAYPTDPRRKFRWIGGSMSFCRKLPHGAEFLVSVQLAAVECNCTSSLCEYASSSLRSSNRSKPPPVCDVHWFGSIGLFTAEMASRGPVSPHHAWMSASPAGKTANHGSVLLQVSYTSSG